MSTPPPQPSSSRKRSSPDVKDKWKQKYKQLKRDYAELREKRQPTDISGVEVAAREQEAMSESTSSQGYLTNYTRPYAGDEKLIPVYDPDDDNDPVEEWVKKVDEIAHRYAWSDNDIVRLASLRLRGHARVWYEGLNRLDIRWTDMWQNLLKKFKTVTRFSNLLKSAANYEARPGQSLGDYCFQKLQRLHALKCNILEECLIDAVIGGVKDENISRTLSSMRFTDTDEMYSRMRAMGNVPIPERKIVQLSLDQGGDKERTSGRSQGLPQGSKLLTCYNCRQAGHLARSCPKPRLNCKKCHKLGHLASKCRIS